MPIRLQRQMGGRMGIEPMISEPQSDVFPLNYQPHKMVEQVGLEPTLDEF